MAPTSPAERPPRDPTPVRVRVDGQSVVLHATAGASLLRALRDHGHTQVMGACEQGECGSCSVLIDGRLECSCLVPAQICDGADIATVRSLLDPDLADALARHGAVQCGFCTPGVVVAAAALLDTAVATLPNEDLPLTDLAVREAMAGNLCRCTGYQGIVAAVLEVDGLRRAVRRRDRGVDR